MAPLGTLFKLGSNIRANIIEKIPAENICNTDNIIGFDFLAKQAMEIICDANSTALKRVSQSPMFISKCIPGFKLSINIPIRETTAETRVFNLGFVLNTFQYINGSIIT